MRLIVDELRYAVRILSRRRLLVSVAIATLGLGIGLTATMFGVVNGVVLRGLPVEAPGRLRYLERTFETGRSGSPSVPLADLLDLQRAQQSFVDLAAFQLVIVNVSGTDVRPQRYSGAMVSANLFDVLGATPRLGRRFLAGEDRPDAAPVAIVSEKIWRDHFAGATSLDGLTLRANGVTHAVAGVMPARFGYPLDEDVWIPMRIEVGVRRGEDDGVEVIGRLRAATAPADAQAEMTTIAARLADAHPETNRGVGLALRTHMTKFLGEQTVDIFYATLVAVIGVLLIAATNVTNLLLALASLRTRELAIRAALGATRRRLMLQMMLEALLLAAAGGLIGFALARVGITLFSGAIADTNPPFWVDIRVDVLETLFLAGLVAVVTVVAGAVPAIRASGTRAGEVLKDEIRGATGGRVGRFSRGLVMVEVALSFGLLVAAGLMVRSVLTVGWTDYGYSAGELLTGGITLPASAYPDTARRLRFWDAFADRLERQPGVRAIALTSNLPGTGSGRIPIGPEGAVSGSPDDFTRVRLLVVSPRFFDALGLQVVAGRDFVASDTANSAPVAIVNHQVTARLFGGTSPIGRRLLVVAPGGAPVATTVVGVAPAIRLGGVRNLDPEAIYLPLAQHPRPAMSVVAQAYGDPDALAPAVREAVALLDPDLPVYALQSMPRALRLTTWFYGVFGAVFVVFGAVALAMVIVGFYGLMAFSVARRTREIGVRMAMGAQVADVLRLVLGQAAAQLGVGLIAGLVLAGWLAPMLAGLLVGVQPWDTAVLGVILLGLVATGLAACLGPALRAVRINPTDALRHD